MGIRIKEIISLSRSIDDEIVAESEREQEEKERRTVIVNRLLGVYNNSTKAFEIKTSKE